jgi:hypothetical protein
MQSLDQNKYTRAGGLALAVVGGALLQTFGTEDGVFTPEANHLLPIAEYTWLAVFGGAFVAADGISRWKKSSSDLAANIAKVGVSIVSLALIVMTFVTGGNMSLALFDEFYRLISMGDHLFYQDGRWVSWGQHGFGQHYPHPGAQMFYKIFAPTVVIPAIAPALLGFTLGRALRAKKAAFESA